jgi:hypothetical protein
MFRPPVVRSCQVHRSMNRFRHLWRVVKVAPVSLAFCLFSAVFAIFPIVVTAQTATGVPFDSEGILSIGGKDVCVFAGTFPDQFGVYLDKRKENALQYRGRDGVVALFLIRKPTDRCGIVEAALNLSSQIHKGETVEFKCKAGDEGGTTWGGWGHIVGLADNRRGTKRFVMPRLAWRVNIEAKRFQKISSQAITCDTSGFTD